MLENRVAHVILVTENPAGLQMLEKALPTKFVDLVTLQDALPEESLYYLKKRIGDHQKIADAESYSKVLGGRLIDLETFSAKVLTGLDPDSK